MNVENASMLIFDYESVGLYRHLVHVLCCGIRCRKDLKNTWSTLLPKEGNAMSANACGC
jgi:hypothetical protein